MPDVCMCVSMVVYRLGPTSRYDGVRESPRSRDGAGNLKISRKKEEVGFWTVFRVFRPFNGRWSFRDALRSWSECNCASSSYWRFKKYRFGALQNLDLEKIISELRCRPEKFVCGL